jgi:hypothetical protein
MKKRELVVNLLNLPERAGALRYEELSKVFGGCNGGGRLCYYNLVHSDKYCCSPTKCVWDVRDQFADWRCS